MTTDIDIHPNEAGYKLDAQVSALVIESARKDIIIAEYQKRLDWLVGKCSTINY